MAFKNEEFRNLMIKAIGNSSRAEFARRCGITPQHLSRLMSEKNDVTPSRTTLQKIADNSSASLEELLVACGYLTSAEESRRGMGAKERAERNADDMIAGFNELTKNTRLYQSLNDFLEDYNMFYGNEDVRFSIGEKKEYIGDRYPNAEYYSPVVAAFTAKHIECKTWVIIYFCETKGGKYIITNVSLSGADLFEAGVVSTDIADLLYEDGENILSLPYLFSLKKLPEVKTPEEKLLAAIFGDRSDEEEFQYNIIGFGFDLLCCPENFKSFLQNHKNTFCKDNYTRKLFEQIVVENKDPEAVLSGYEDSRTADFGYGAAISIIMREETDIEFGWYVNENNEKGCVMLTESEIWYSSLSDTELKDTVYQYAKELGLKEYGECVCMKMISRDPTRIYKIEEND